MGLMHKWREGELLQLHKYDTQVQQCSMSWLAELTLLHTIFMQHATKLFLDTRHLVLIAPTTSIISYSFCTLGVMLDSSPLKNWKTSSLLCYIFSPHAHIYSSQVIPHHKATIYPDLSKNSISPARLPVRVYNYGKSGTKWTESDGEEMLSERFLKFKCWQQRSKRFEGLVEKRTRVKVCAPKLLMILGHTAT